MPLDDPNDSVEVVDHYLGWKASFLLERQALLEAMGDIAISIDHIGSTAVSGLAAKPIIDIMIGVTHHRSPEDYIQLLSPLEYVYQAQEDEPRRFFFRKGMPRTHHLHIVVEGSEVQLRHIRFRDRLRGDPELVEEYSSLKRELARRFREDREAYCAGKREFIERVSHTSIKVKTSYQ